MGMPDSCFATCIMETRIKGLEEHYAKQADQYREDSVNNAIQMTEMKKDIKSILKMQSDMNDNLNKVLEENQKRQIEKAATKNEVQATKWKSLSAGTKAVVVSIICSALALILAYAFNQIITK